MGPSLPFQTRLFKAGSRVEGPSAELYVVSGLSVSGIVY